MAKVIGITLASFTPKDSTTPIEGATIHITEPIDPRRGKGESADHFFLSKNKLDALGFEVVVGVNVEVLYSKYGKVISLRRLLDDDILID